MSDDAKKKPLDEITRRDTFKLATAVSALGVGLGVSLDGDEASAATHKIDAAQAGTITVKLYKWIQDGKPPELLHTVDLNAIAIKQHKFESLAGRYALKLYNHKGEATAVLGEHELHIIQQKI